MPKYLYHKSTDQWVEHVLIISDNKQDTWMKSAPGRSWCFVENSSNLIPEGCKEITKKELEAMLFLDGI